MSRVFYRFVLFRQDLNSVYHRVEEELRKHIPTVALPLRGCLSLEHEVNSVFHYVESALALVSHESVPDLLVYLGKGPGRSFICFAL